MYSLFYLGPTKIISLNNVKSSDGRGQRNRVQEASVQFWERTISYKDTRLISSGRVTSNNLRLTLVLLLQHDIS